MTFIVLLTIGCRPALRDAEYSLVEHVPSHLAGELLARGVRISDGCCPQAPVPEPVIACARVTGTPLDMKGAASVGVPGSSGTLLIECGSHQSWQDLLEEPSSSVTVEGPLWVVTYPEHDPDVLKAKPSGGDALMMLPCRVVEPPPAVEPAPTARARSVVGGMVTGNPSEIAEGTPVRWTEVEVKERPTISESDFPQEARERGLPGEQCNVRLYVDEMGVPYDVKALACSEIFFPAAREIAMRYRFYPATIEEKPIRVEFDLLLNFRQ